jgi:CheY-like chemotaxis protein
VTKVLYVEDNDDNVYMLKMRLELLGDFEVMAAEDGPGLFLTYRRSYDRVTVGSNIFDPRRATRSQPRSLLSIARLPALFAAEQVALVATAGF